MDVRDGLKTAVSQSGMKQAYIARQAHLNPAKLSDILNKRRKLDANVLLDVCRVIQIKPGEIYDLTMQNVASPGGRG